MRFVLPALREKLKLPGAASVILAATLGLAAPASAQPYTEETIHHFSPAPVGGTPWASVIKASDGNLYGTTRWGGSIGAGTVFKISNPTTTPVESVIYSFTGAGDGGNPIASLIQLSDGSLYGTTLHGGGSSNCRLGCGTVFKISNLATSPIESVIYSFTGGSDGANPWAPMIQDIDDLNLYGTTAGGGSTNCIGGCGTVFRISNPTAPSPVESVIYSFTGSPDGNGPSNAAVIRASDGNLYGTTYLGGSTNCAGGCGTVFEIINPTTLNPTYNPIHSFTGGADGGNPFAAVIQASDGNLYGTTEIGGSSNCTGGCGTVFKISNLLGIPTESVIYSFLYTGSDGGNPDASLIQLSDGNLYGTTTGGGGPSDGGTVFRISNLAGPGFAIETPIYSFLTAGIDGFLPVASMILDTDDNNLYGTTWWGGSNSVSTGNGTVFRISNPMAPTPTETLICNFLNAGSDGGNPSSVIQASDGNLYGATANGGSSGAGTVFKISNPTSSPSESLGYSFTGGSDGGNPSATLIQLSDGNLYGTTFYGGSSGCCGTVFRISNLSPPGTPVESAIYSFTGGGDGGSPTASLIQASDGNLYGTTRHGGSSNNGTVFKISNPTAPSPAESVIYSFAGGSDGANPFASVIQASDGNLYGTTYRGGGSSNCIGGCGTVFQITNPTGSPGYNMIFSFTGGADGGNPDASLIQASDGNLYGTTRGGGSSGCGGSGCGTVFQISLTGAETPIYTFTGGADGGNPFGSLMQASDCNWYGTTSHGGLSTCYLGCGTVFQITNLTTPSPTYSVIYNFTGLSDGGNPSASLIQASDGKLYGTAGGGIAGAGVVFRIDGAAITIGPSTLPNGQAGVSYSQTVFALGGTAPYTFSVTAGGPPPGLALDSATGHLTGTPTTSGTYLFTVTATVANGCTGSQAYSIVVNASGCLGVVVSPSTLPDGQVGISYGQTVSGNDGTGPYIFSVASGTLPPGLSLDPVTGNITGTPTAFGSYGFTLLATDASSCSGSRDYSINVAPASVITVSAISPGHGSSAGGDAVTITGGFFQSGATVTIAGQPATGVTVVSATQITAATPANPAGTVGDVVVTNPDATNAAIASGFSYDYLDVPASNVFQSFISAIARAAITAGCSGGDYCPDNPVLRSQMAVFLLTGEHGSTFTAPSAVGIFGDVPASDPFAPWIERLYDEGITGGCSTNPLMYCPGNPVTRAGMAVFLLEAEHGAGYAPPACASVFSDVACPGPFTNFIEQLYHEGITGGCSSNPLMYCPGNPVTRAQMAVFLTVTFGLQ